MRILHFADLHLGVETYGHLDAATGLNSRFLDFLNTLDRLVDYAVQTHVDLVLFCGDAYKTREPTQTQQREFARRIRCLSENGIPVFLLVGNHDLPNAMGRATSTEIFDTLAVSSVYVSNKPEVSRIPTKSGIIQIATLPWLRRSALLNREDLKTLDLESLKKKLEDILTGIILHHASELDSKLPAILAAHVWVVGSVLGSERSMSLGMEHGLLLGNIANPAFDYIALGHVHKQQVLNTNPPVVYSGSPDRIDFGEEADDKGFFEIEIKNDGTERQTGYSFHKLEGRRFLTIKVNIEASDGDPTGTVIGHITGQPVKDSIVRIQISLPEVGSSQINDPVIRNALKEAYYFNISKESAKEVRLRLGKFTAEELTPLNALKAYLETKKVDPARAKLLMEYGEKLINEVNSKQ
jgi:DNA repair protein SbcD/Mre11